VTIRIVGLSGEWCVNRSAGYKGDLFEFFWPSDDEDCLKKRMMCEKRF